MFLAAGAMALPGAHLGRAATAGLGAVVHVGAIVAPYARIPAGWIAVGDPARIHPRGRSRVELPALQAIQDPTGQLITQALGRPGRTK